MNKQETAPQPIDWPARMRNLLENLAVTATLCPRCGQRIAMMAMPAGGINPYNYDGTSHYTNCPIKETPPAPPADGRRREDRKPAESKPWPKPVEPADIQRQADEWNRNVKIGDQVRYWPLLSMRESFKDGKTHSNAYVLGGHTAVVHITGVAGCVAISHCAPIGEEPAA